MKTEEALFRYFGYKTFRPNQKEIIDSILEGNNALAVLPTGAGKSLCYQIPSLVSENFSIVISPLIALMKNQVDSLNGNGKISAFINSTMNYYETEEVLRDIAYGKTKLLYVAPERLENSEFAERIKKLNPSFLFVDEAHCISEWGHNFRPSYRKISEFVDYVEIKKISAFTATATPEVVKDIVKQLGLKNPKLFVRGFERDNLHLNAFITKNKKQKSLELVSHYKTPAIIYTASRKNAEEVSEYLNMHRIHCEYYHAGLAPEERKRIQENFLNDKTPVIAATNAFGMGIDKKDIRLIIHYNTPGSIENYYQEIGRAGRDGNSSHAFLLHDDSDINIQNYFLSSSHPDKEVIQNIYSAICDYGKVALGNMSSKEIPLNYDYISAYAKKKLNRGLIYSTLKILEEGNYLRLLSEFEKRTTLQFTVDKNRLKKFIVNISNENIKQILLLLLREYGSEIFINRINIPEEQIAKRLDLEIEDVEDVFITLDNLGIASFSKPLGKENVILTSPRVVPSKLNVNYKKLNENYLRLQKKIDSMVDYVYEDDCRFKFILEYFGEDVKNYRCNKCDRCTSEDRIPDSTSDYVKEIILRTLNQTDKSIHEASLLTILKGSSRTGKYSNFDTYGSCSNYEKSDLKFIIHELISDGFIARKVEGSLNYIITGEGKKFLVNNGIVESEIEEEFHYDDNLQLYNSLREVRKIASKKFMQTGYMICPDEVLREISIQRPKTKSELLSINGFNNRMFNKLGLDFIEVINEYIKDKETKPEVKKEDRTVPENIRETFNLLQKNYTLKEIASLRKLAEPVISMQIESIIEYYPKIDISHLFSNGSFEKIMKEIENGYTDLKELKQRLPKDISFSLIRIAVAKFKFT